MESNYYKIVDEENGYARYIQETDIQTIIISLGARPKREVFIGPYKKQPDEVILPGTSEEFSQKQLEYDSYKENLEVCRQ